MQRRELFVCFFFYGLSPFKRVIMIIIFRTVTPVLHWITNIGTVSVASPNRTYKTYPPHPFSTTVFALLCNTAGSVPNPTREIRFNQSVQQTATTEQKEERKRKKKRKTKKKKEIKKRMKATNNSPGTASTAQWQWITRKADSARTAFIDSQRFSNNTPVKDR